MAVDVQAIVGSTVGSLGYELVDLERTARGLLRVYIDKESGISVEDCANVSNHLSRLFAVEGIDFERLEVSSPGLDRPLKSVEDFQRFVGRSAKVKLNASIDGRKRFEGVIETVAGSQISFRLIDDVAKPVNSRVAATKAIGKKVVGSEGKSAVGAAKASAKEIMVPHENIDRARLVPEI